MATRLRRLALQLMQLQGLPDSSGSIESAVALQRPELDTGGIDFPPVDEDDDEGDDDDEEWSWQALDARFKPRMQEWAKTSPAAKKIAGIIYEHTFAKKPKIKMTRHGGAGRKYGRLQMDLAWAYGGDIYDDFEDEFVAILKRSDLYKVFGARPDQLWGILDKGEVFPWVLYYILMEMSGRNWRDQSSADKQAAFQVYDFVTKNKAKYQQWIQKRLNPGIPLSITVSRPLATYGQVYNGDFIAGGVVYWEYEPAEAM